MIRILSERAVGLPLNISVAQADLESHIYPLTQADALLLPHAGLKRRQEFSGGRACARALLSMLGARDVSLLVSPSGAPIWPTGFVGSITHSEKMALCAVASADNYRSIGIDTEIVGCIEEGIMDLLFSRREIKYLSALDMQHRDAAATALFCAKEAFFKANDELQNLFKDMSDIEVDLDLCARTFHVIGSDSLQDKGVFYYRNSHCVAFFLRHIPHREA